MKHTPRRRRHFRVEALESRVLFSATGFQPLQAIVAAVTTTAVSWVGGTTGDWNTASNWSGDAVPNSTNDVTIPSGVTVTLSTGNQSINSLQANGNLTLTGGSLTIAANSNVNGVLNVGNATLATNGTLELLGSETFASGAVMAGSGTFVQGFENTITFAGDTTLSGSLSNPGTINLATGATLTVTGTYTQTTQFAASGSLFGPGALIIANGGVFSWQTGAVSNLAAFTVQSGGKLNIPGDVALDGTTLENQGAITLTSEGISFTNNAVLTNDPGATFNVTGQGNSTTLSGDGTINNNGTIVTGGDSNGNSVTIVTVFNSGSGSSVENTSGNLSLFGGPGYSMGTWQADSGAQITFAGDITMDAGSAWNGSGLYSVTGTVTIDSSVTLSPAQLQVNGTLGGAGNLTMPAGSTWVVAPGNGSGTISGPGTLTISSGATLNLGNGPVSDIELSNNLTVVNNGSILVNAEYVYFQGGGSLTNNGTFEVQTGPTTTGNILTIGSGFVAASPLDNTVFTNNGTFQVDAAAGGLNLYGQFDNDGTFTVGGGAVLLENDSSFPAATSSGIFSVPSGAALTFASDQVFASTVLLDGAGSYTVQQATLTLADASLDLSPINFTLGGVLTGPGAFTVTSGSTFNFEAQSSIQTGGAFTIQNGGVFDYPGSSSTLQGTALVNHGQINFDPGTNESSFSLLDNAVLTNEADGTMTLAFAQSQFPGGGATGGLIQDDGTGTINNLGTMIFQGSNAAEVSTLIVIGTFNNPGTLEVQGGLLDLGEAVSQVSPDGTTLTGGTWDVTKGGTLTVDAASNVTTNEATVSLSGPGASFNALTGLSSNSGGVAITGGAVLAINPNGNSGGGGGGGEAAIIIGSQPNDTPAGSLTNSGVIEVDAASQLQVPGDFTQTSSGTLIEDLAGAANTGLFGVVAVTGTATLAGTLDVQFDNGFRPSTVGDAYTFLTYASVSGNFTSFTNVSPQFSAVPGVAGDVLTVLSTALPDLAASAVSGPAGAAGGQNMTVTYTVTNNGAASASGNWTDSVYLSPGTTFDPTTAILLGNYQYSGGLGVGDSYTGTVTAVTPGLIPANYSIIVVTDSLGQVTDADRANNTADSAVPVTVSAPALVLDGPTITGTIANGQEQLYELDLQGNSQAVINLSTAVAAGAEIYLSYNTQPSPASFDQTAFNLTGDSDSIVLTGNQPGPYFILVSGREASGDGENFSLQAQSSNFGLTSATPASGTGTTTITLTGSQLAAGDTVTLVPTTGGGASLTASAVYLTAANTLAATFNLAGTETGAVYGVQVSNGTTVATLPQAFTIGAQANPTEPVAVSITAPNFVRTGENYTILVNYTNVSGEDQPAPLINLSATNVLFELPDSIVFSSGTVSFVGVDTGGGPEGILPPGYQGSITIQVEQTVDAPHTVMSYSYSLSDPSQTMNYAALAPYLDSGNYTADQWNAVWAQTQQLLGTTQAGYLQALSTDATLLPAAEGSNLDPIQDMQVTLAQAQADITTSIQGRISSASPGLTLGGLILFANNTTTGETYGTYVLNDGSFVLPALDAGTYTLTLDGALLGASSPLTVAANQQVTGVALTASTGDSLAGTIANGTNGTILAGATVDLTGANGEVYSTTSDANGKYSFTGLPDDTYAVTAVADGFARTDVSETINAAGVFLNLSLALQATITGTVTPASNSSTGDTPLIIAQPLNNTDPNQVYSVSPDSTGDFTLSNLPAGTYDLTISLPGYGTDQITNVTVAAGGTQALPPINLTATATVGGTVTSSDPNDPASGLAVGAYQNGTLIGSTTADANGNYSIAGLAPGSYEIEPIGYPYFASDPSVTLSPGQTQTGIDLSVQPGGVISGTITDSSSNQPLGGLTVYALGPNGIPTTAYTDANGNYSFNHLALGSYQVFLALSGANSSAGVTVSTLDPTSVTANLQTTVAETITGTLYLADGATPVANGTLNLLQNGQTVATASTGTDGTYTFLLQQPGTFSIQAAGTNASFNLVNNVVVAAGQTVTQNIDAGAGSIDVMVADSAQAVAGSTVDVYQASTNMEVAYAVVGANGQVMVPNLVDGDYNIVEQAPNSRGVNATATVSGGAMTTANLVQVQQATVTGTLTDSGTGNVISGGSISFYSTTNPNVSFSVPVAANGTYSLANLPAGNYDGVAVSAGYAATVNFGLTVNPGGAPMNFQLPTDSSVFTGTILNKDGAPVVYAHVVVLNSSNEILGQAYTDTTGKFVITGVSGSNLEVRVTVGADPLVDQKNDELPKDETTDEGPIMSAYGVFDGLQKLAQSAIASIQNAIQNVQNDINLLSNPTGLLQRVLNQVNQFNHAPNEVTLPPPPTSNCPEDNLAYARLKVAVMQQNMAFKSANDDKMLVQTDVTLFNATYHTELLQNLTTGLGLVVVALTAMPEVIAYLQANAIIAVGVQVTAVAQSAFSLASNAQNTVTAVQNATTGGDLDSQISPGLAVVAQTGAEINAAAASLQSIISQHPLPPAFGVVGGIVSAITGLLNGGLAHLNFSDTHKAAVELSQDGQQFLTDRQSYLDAVSAANQALQAYNQSLANNSQGCGNHSQGGAPSKPQPGPGPVSLSGHDPNDLFGPAGFGTENFIPAAQPLAYRIDFENDPTASAPTAVVTITETLDPNADLSTFQLGSFGFGGITIDVPAGLTAYSTVVPDPAAGLDVDVSASLNAQTGVVTWTFTSIDPTTGQVPSDPLVGFLPPDVTAPEGLGFVTYTVSPKAGLSTGTTISAQASVVFDANPAISTPTYTNTLDTVAPTSQLVAIPAQEAPDFTLQWSGADNPGGSGLAFYDVYYSTNGGSYQPLLLNTTNTAAVFRGTVNDTYGFYVVAVDNVGNVEAAPATAEDTTMIVAPQTFTVTSKKAFSFTDAAGAKVTVKLTGPGSVVGLLDGGVANGADLRSLELENTTAKTSLSVTVAKNGPMQIAEIFTESADQSLGGLSLGPEVTLGDGLDDGTTALDLTGSVKSLVLGEIAADAQIDLGTDLTGAAATASKPAFSSGAILGSGVTIDLTGNLGAAKIASWNFAGSLEATLGITSLAVAGPLLADVTATSLGALSAQSINGVTVTATGAVGNITVKAAGQTGSVSAIDGLTVTAASIGNITATITDPAAAITDNGIVGSTFTATGGNIGAIKSSVAGPSGLASGTAIADSTFDSETGSIGNITATVTSSGANAQLVGIVDSDFAAMTSIGAIAAAATSTTKQTGSGSGAGIETDTANVDFNAGTSIGAITVTAAGSAAQNAALDASQSERIQFTAGATVGTVSVSASKSKFAGSTAFALAHVDLTAGGAVGKLLVSGDANQTQVEDFQVYAGGSIAGIDVTSTDKTDGSVTNSTILAGQLQAITKSGDLAKAGIGFVTITGSFTDVGSGPPTIGAQGNIGAVKIGGAFQDVRLVAGINAGPDRLPYTSDDTYNDAASIASVSIGGAFDDSTIAAGVNPGADFVFGDSTDTAGTPITGITTKSKIGAITLGAATVNAGVTAPFQSPAAADQSSAIESLALTSIRIGKFPVFKDFTAPVWIDANGDGTEQSDETLIRVVS